MVTHFFFSSYFYSLFLCCLLVWKKMGSKENIMQTVKYVLRWRTLTQQWGILHSDQKNGVRLEEWHATTTSEICTQRALDTIIIHILDSDQRLLSLLCCLSKGWNGFNSFIQFLFSTLARRRVYFILFYFFGCLLYCLLSVQQKGMKWFRLVFYIFQPFILYMYTEPGR